MVLGVGVGVGLGVGVGVGLGVSQPPPDDPESHPTPIIRHTATSKTNHIEFFFILSIPHPFLENDKLWG